MKFDRSPIFEVSSRAFVPIMLLFSLFLLSRGHNEPGGGFTGGLLAAGAFVVEGMAVGVDEARRKMRLSPETFIAIGLLLAVSSAAVAVVRGQVFFQSVWLSPALGTPLLFDLGVFLVVFGITTLIMFSLWERG